MASLEGRSDHGFVAVPPNHRLQLTGLRGLGRRCSLGFRLAAAEALNCECAGQCPQLKRGSLGRRHRVLRTGERA